MMKSCLALALLLPPLSAAEISVVPRVDSVGLFKNGVTVVRASFEADAAGSYRWDGLPRSIHGSFWVESDGVVTVLAITRSVEQPAAASGILQRDLAGQVVSVRLKDGDGDTLEGKVWTLPESPAVPAWPADPTTTADPWGRFPTLPRTEPPATTGGFLVLEDEAGGRRFLDLDTIASVTVPAPAKVAMKQVDQPVMVFQVTTPPRDRRVRISYLARGMAWSPAYRMDLAEGGKLSIRRSATVRNELLELTGADIELISGHPNIGFSHVDSPLWSGATLSAFFQQLGQAPGQAAASTQQLVMYNAMTPAAPALPDFAEGRAAGDDLHHESVGPQSLRPGDSLALDLGVAETTCERVVEWVVADPRDGGGRYRPPHETQADSEPWDSLKFTNPFRFPLTTAPVMITENGRFRGQSMGQWVNPGQSTCLRVTKALSLQTRSSEIEEEGQREAVWIAGNDYRRTTVKATLELRNFRGAATVIDVRAGFSGELIETAGNPASRLRTDGVTSVNPRRELTWSVKLAAGEEKTIVYRYSVLVDQ
jgi:hypothetical protein